MDAKELGRFLVILKLQPLASLVQIEFALELLVQAKKVLKFLAQAQQFLLPQVQAQ